MRCVLLAPPSYHHVNTVNLDSTTFLAQKPRHSKGKKMITATSSKKVFELINELSKVAGLQNQYTEISCVPTN